MDRRYDIDWIRVIVLGLLIVYHAWCSFMPFAKEIYMPQNKDFLMTMGIPMSLINIWRIPLLFMISGMGMFFAMQRRSWKEMIKDSLKKWLRIIEAKNVEAESHIRLHMAKLNPKV